VEKPIISVPKKRPGKFVTFVGALSVQDFLHPVTVFLFPKLKVALMVRSFDDITIQKQLQATLTKFKTQDFCKCFQQWCER
jgi:hypothetical protein